LRRRWIPRNADFYFLSGKGEINALHATISHWAHFVPRR
jgi:hypothetical protein